MRDSLFVIAVLLGLSAPAFAQAPALRGQALAEKFCGECHATGRSGKSALPTAPAFRDLPKRLDLDTFSERLQDGLISGHRDMPRFTFRRPEADALVAWLRAIEAP